MRHFRIFRPSFGLMLRMLAGVAVCAVSSSCTDDTFDKHGQQGASGMLAFDVAAPGSWANGSAATRAADKDISIRKLTQSGGGKPLYLVTEIAEAAVDTAASNAITRGTTTTGETFKDHSFGLSAICYTGEWPEEGENNPWTTNFAHNMEVSYTEGGDKWQSKAPLHWVGSGNIKFFAYSPYFAEPASPGSPEEGAADADDAAPSVIHSAKDATGVPTLTYTVPAEVTKQIDLMYATADCGGNGTGKDALNGAVKLSFKHALTAVTIKTGKNVLAGKVTGIEISGVHGSGIYPIGAAEWKTTDEAVRTFSIDNEMILDTGDDILADPGIDLNPDEDGYTFMMIPQALADDATLTISFASTPTNTEHTLTAKLKDFTEDEEWKIGKQYTYSINTTGIVIEPVIELTVNRENTLYPNGGQIGKDQPEHPQYSADSDKKLYKEMTDEQKLEYLPVSGVLNDVSIVAYMRVIQEKAKSEEIRKLDFTIEWSDDGGDTWSSSEKKPELGWKPAAISQSRADDTDPTNPVSGSILLPAQPQFTYMQGFLYGRGESIEKKTLPGTITGDGKGSETEPYDLVENNDSQESANCYIVNDHGYYKFPTYYGNTYKRDNDDSPYTYGGNFEALTDEYKKLVLDEFVGHDDLPISGGLISGILDAVLLWQDSPDLVTDVKYDNANNCVSFRVPKETINQGNAVIAVRSSDKTILWSWHIWVTHRDWYKQSITLEMTNEKGMPFIIAPSNLGYCEPHGGDSDRNLLMRFVATSIPAGNGGGVILNECITVNGAPLKSTGTEEEAIIEFVQPKIAASAAGDNTYYQWGRKDPMLPGIHNNDTYGASGSKDTGFEYDMVNKMFYSSKEYRFTSSESARTIGDGIKYPYQFFMHKRPPTDDGKGNNATPDDPTDNFKRRHWHDGSEEGLAKVAAPYDRKSIMNYWNANLDKSTISDFDYNRYIKGDQQPYLDENNGIYVIKTIYDPSPAGFKIPPIRAFADFLNTVTEFKEGTAPNGQKYTYSETPNAGLINSSEGWQGWKVTIPKGDFYFPATGVRDMGTKETEVTYGTYPGFSSLTYIAASGFHKTPGTGSGSSCLMFSIDKRTGSGYYFPNCTRPYHGTNNAYGFTVRPIRDGQK